MADQTVEWKAVLSADGRVQTRAVQKVAQKVQRWVDSKVFHWAA